MCDTYVNSVGYVCSECQSEFKECLESEGKTDLTESEMKRELEKFMNTTKESHVQGEKIGVDDFFNKHSM